MVSFSSWKWKCKGENDFPTIVSRSFVSHISSRIIIPVDSSVDIPISSAQHIIPRLSIHAIIRSPMIKSHQRTAPTIATGTYVASAIFCAL